MVLVPCRPFASEMIFYMKINNNFLTLIKFDYKCTYKHITHLQTPCGVKCRKSAVQPVRLPVANGYFNMQSYLNLHVTCRCLYWPPKVQWTQNFRKTYSEDCSILCFTRRESFPVNTELRATERMRQKINILSTKWHIPSKYINRKHSLKIFIRKERTFFSQWEAEPWCSFFYPFFF